MKKILFLCTGNSCRSQMAEGWGKKLLEGKYEVYSAGTKAQGLNPWAVKVMEEVGIDISKHTSKTVDDLGNLTFDWVITVCGHAHENCPYFLGKVIHVGFEDPPFLAQKLAQEGASLEKQQEPYRRVRDEIRIFIENIEKTIS